MYSQAATHSVADLQDTSYQPGADRWLEKQQNGGRRSKWIVCLFKCCLFYPLMFYEGHWVGSRIGGVDRNWGCRGSGGIQVWVGIEIQ